MTIMDPISDLFTRIRNALQVKHDSVIVPHSKSLESIVKILETEGFINGFAVLGEDTVKKNLKIDLKYVNGKSVISNLKRVSKPSKRIYVKKSDVPKVLNGFGVSIISTSKGVMSGRDARVQNVGGELIGELY